MEPGSKQQEPERNGMPTMASRTRQFNELAAALHKEVEVVRSLRCPTSCTKAHLELVMDS